MNATEREINPEQRFRPKCLKLTGKQMPHNAGRFNALLPIKRKVL